MGSFEFDGKRIIRSGSDLFFKTHLCGERWDDLKKPTDTFLKECIRALLADRAEVVALYWVAMEVAREATDDCDAGADAPWRACTTVARWAKLDALDARFKKLEAGQ